MNNNFLSKFCQIKFQNFIRINILMIFLFLMVSLNAQLAKVSNKDTILEHKIIKDKDGRILSWYKPEIPGAGYAHVAKLASEFMIKSCPKDEKTGLPWYLLTCCFQGPHMTKDNKFLFEEWAHDPACVFAASVQSFAIDYRNFSGDNEYLEMVRGMLDYEIQNGTTPAGWEWEKVPYASSNPGSTEYEGAFNYEKEKFRGDGLQGIEPDKIGELGVGYIKFYEMTGDTKYLEAAINCANALAKHVRILGTETSPFIEAVANKSPWPFRVNARTGRIIDEYSSNVIEPIRLLDELVRIKDVIKLTSAQADTFKKTRDIAWNWLYSRSGPMITNIWNGYFEDIPGDPMQTNRVHNTPMETARYIIKNPETDKDINKSVPALINYVRYAFRTDGMDMIKEQTWCYEPMGSHTARYASVCALWYERTGDVWFKDQAYRFFNVATYMTYSNGVVAVGPNWPGSWFADGYADYVKHFMEGMAAVPEWAPAGEDHLLKSSSVVKFVSYKPTEIKFTTFDKASKEVLRLASKPKKITVNGKLINEIKELNSGGFTWQALTVGGVLKIRHDNGYEVGIVK
jgi:hypothetical protein